MPTTPIRDPAIMAALDSIAEFVEKTTGTAPTSAELANALTRYFVLNEIKEHIEMLRQGASETE